MLQRAADAAGEIDWTTHFVDDTVVRAHQRAAGEVGGQEHEAVGRSLGGFSEVHVRAGGGGVPMALLVSTASATSRATSRRCAPAGECDAQDDAGRAAGRRSSLAIRLTATRRCAGFSRAVASTPSSHAAATSTPATASTGLSTGRCIGGATGVERLINGLKQHRRVATRYETRAGHYAAMLTVAAVLLWLRSFAHAP